MSLAQSGNGHQSKFPEFDVTSQHPTGELGVMKATNYSPKDLIASPCQEKWCEMTGDERERFCDKCQLTVVNLTGKSIEEIRTLREKSGGRLCGRFDLRAAKVAVGAGMASLALASCDTKQSNIEGVHGEIESPQVQTTPEKTPSPAPKIIPTPEPPKKPPVIEKPIDPPMIMGDICLPAPPIDPSKQA